LNNLILVKHSLPEVVSTVPAKEWRLSQSGQLRCKALAEKLASWLPDVVISSTEPKALETAQIIANHLDKPFSMFEGLHEHDRTGVDLVDKEQFETRVNDFLKNPDKLVFGRETAGQSLARFTKALASVEFEHPNKNIVVVAHGTVITLFVDKFNKIEAFSFWRKLDLPSFVVLSLPQHKLVKIVEGVV
jgi:broad specificity phosphatase PhoE